MELSGVLLWLVGALAGSMVFFGAIVAPLVFRTLPAESAGSFLRAFFPRYYIWGTVLAALATLVAVFHSGAMALLGASVAILFVFARQWLMPKINDARDASADGDAEATMTFERLHKLSVAINMLQLLIILGIAARLIW